MSFSDRPTVPPHKALGCIFYCAAATAVVFFFMLMDALGDCADGPGSSCKTGWAHFLMFPGSLIIAIVLGLFLLRWAMRSESDD